MKLSAALSATLCVVLLLSCGSSNNLSKSFPFNTRWELEYLSGPRIAFEGLFPDKKPHLTFNETEGHAAGNSGCNGYMVPFELDGATISFGQPAPSTLMYCGEGEDFFRQTLEKTDGWQVDADGKLMLLIGDVPMMRFKKQAP